MNQKHDALGKTRRQHLVQCHDFNICIGQGHVENALKLDATAYVSYFMLVLTWPSLYIFLSYFYMQQGKNNNIQYL